MVWFGGRQNLRLAATLVLVAVAYYVGSLIGFRLTFPHSTPSVLWPPNAILTATLLLTAPRRWPLYLLATLPAHLVVQLPMSPPALVLSLFLTNCSEAVLAATVVRWFSDQPARFDSLRRMAAFVVGAGFVGPFLSSFADAAVVVAFRNESYWDVWRTRFFSNVLTGLTIVPTIVILATGGLRHLLAIRLRRLPEAALLALGLLIVTVLAVRSVPADGSGILHAPGALLALLLPFLLWSAVRFGAGGVSVCLLGTAVLAIGTATSDTELLAGPWYPVVSVMGFQLFLSAMGVPLMCLAGVIEERRRANRELEDRLRFEELVSRLSTDFVHLPSMEIDRTFDVWLGRLGEHIGVDAVALVDLAEGGDHFTLRRWTAKAAESGLCELAVGDFPWALARLRAEQPVVFSDPDELPGQAERERALVRQHGIRAAIVLPLEAGGRILGGLAVAMCGTGPVWDSYVVGKLRLIGEVFASTLARRETEDALRASEGMKSAILSSLSSGVAVLDREGTIIAVNESWGKRTIDVGPSPHGSAGLGDNYLKAWSQSADTGASYPPDAVAGIEAVLEGRRDGFAIEYAWPDSAGGRWFSVSAVPLNRLEGGAVISSTDITEWKHAELNAQRSREELAHFSRVSTMGALAASLAHELNQPLGGILTNAQAARRFLASDTPDLDEIRGILADIVEDDKRAGEVIERLRELLRKGDLEVVRLDISVLVRDVARLLGSDALIRGVSIQLALPSEPLPVHGDRIQLQQVMLNLLVNAMDAMTACPTEDRIVVVEARSGEDAVRVAVTDRGAGFDPAKQELIFEPFYTTKPQGMGMGLSISRTIVEAHGGQIWATNNPIRGATVSFTVPLAPKKPA